MDRIDPRHLTCPLCGARFDGWLVLAGRARGPKSTDLRQFTDGEDPLPKQLNGCPDCGFAGEVTDFEEMAPEPLAPVEAAATGAYWAQEEWEDSTDPLIADRAKPTPSTLSAQVDEHLRPRAGAAAADPAPRYEHRAQIARWQGLGPLREGDAWLRAAWLHGDARREDDERRCRRRALGCYRVGVAEQRWFRRREDLVVVAYLVGELHRRLGEGDEARRWFEQAVAWSSGLQRMQDLVELAERQTRDPRELV